MSLVPASTSADPGAVAVPAGDNALTFIASRARASSGYGSFVR